jgi:hypothetical protein
MIQRIQTIWLLLAVACTLASLKFSFYSGSTEKGFEELNTASGFLLLLLTVATALTAAIIVFLFKKRKLQMQLSWLGIVLQSSVIGLLISKTNDFTQGNFSLTSLFAFVVPVFFLLAWIGIRKDEKLVKSMDRLR